MSEELNEVWTLYADDGVQALDAIEDALARLSEEPADTEAIASLFRGLHTFKGNARVLGLAVIEARSHTAEDLIGAVRDEGVPLDGEIQALLLETADALRGLLEESATHRRDAAPEGTLDLERRLVDKLERCRRAQAEPPAEDEAPAPEENEPEALIFDDEPPGSLADDPLYRQIFADMARESLAEMAKLTADPQRFGEEVERLRYAADQIGLPEWPGLLAAFLAEPSDAQAFLEHLGSLFERDFALSPAPAEEPAPVAESGGFFDDLDPLLAALEDVETQGTLTTGSLRPIAEGLTALAGPRGFVRVSEAAEQLATSATPADLRNAQWRLFEELVSIETALPDEAESARTKPTDRLRAWCARHVFENLCELARLLDHTRHGEEDPGTRFDALMRQVHHACHHHALDTAAQLGMALVDLFDRAQAGEMALDPVLSHIARSYIAALELVFNAIDSGQAPDMAAIETLLEEASNVAFANGGVSVSAVEARLGLPPAFRKVLTPDNARSAIAAIEDGRRFYIIRADLNRNEAMAGPFLEWINSGAATAISNVTVFDGDATLFDFLLATPLDEVGLTEALAALDPAGRSLSIEQALQDNRKTGSGDVVTGDDGLRGAARRGLSDTMQEAIGEIVASQGVVRHLLNTLGHDDLVRRVESEVVAAGGDWGSAKGAVHRILEDMAARIDLVLQAESQLDTHLAELQEEAVALRTRPAALLLRPLKAFAEQIARQNGQTVAVTMDGEEEAIDQEALESLKGPLRRLVAWCVLSTPEPSGRQLKIQLDRHNDHVALTLDSDTTGDPQTEDVEAIADEFRHRGGDLRAAARPDGGTRFHVAMPVSMAVVEGMVVRVGEVRYVVPIEAIQRIVHAGSADVMRVSADQGRRMLRLGRNEVVPIRAIGAADGEPSGQPSERRLFITVGKAASRVALAVDELLGQQTVLIRPLLGYLAGIRGVTGCALLGGGEVGMVLDMTQMIGSAD